MKSLFAWDENNKGSQDPWQKNRQSNTPPDLDELLKRLLKRLNQWLGSGSNNPLGSGSQKSGSRTFFTFSFGLIGALILIIWFLSGLFILGPAEQAVITRFGKYHKTLDAGLHWIPSFIDKRYVLNVENVSNFSYTSSMLTQDENIVSVSVAIQYRIGDLKQYLFAVVNPIESLQQATASALRQVIGHTSLDDVLTVGRETVRKKVHEQLNSILETYQAGLMLMDVVMQPAKPPEEVKSAFDDAIKAQEDEQRYVNQAESYARGVIPRAEGDAKRILQAAEAYKEQKILTAKGDVAKFLSILPEFRKAPELTRERLYIDTLENIFSKTSKIILDIKNGNQLFYLPLDKWGLSDGSRILEERDKQAISLEDSSESSSRSQQEDSTSVNAERDQDRLIRDESYQGRFGRDSYPNRGR